MEKDNRMNCRYETSCIKKINPVGGHTKNMGFDSHLTFTPFAIRSPSKADHSTFLMTSIVKKCEENYDVLSHC